MPRPNRKRRKASPIAELKERVEMVDVLAHVGAEIPPMRGWGSWVSMRCPFHDDTRASGAVNMAENKFHCHACLVSGDVIDIAKEHLGTEDVNQAIEWLERTFV